MPEPRPPVPPTTVRREVVLAVDTSRLWRALTEPGEIGAWLDAGVRWDLVPGGTARFTPGDGPARAGRVLDVVPGRRLRFAWWPEDGDEGDATVVGYDLDPEPDGEGTRLVVTEEPATPAASAGRIDPEAGWSGWDGRLLSLWVSATAPAAIPLRRPGCSPSAALAGRR